ncbi:hypothetical protein GGI08_000895 [Coemansia sp. S2]|nr:hypothetical protein GGI08_000895 [Coemansia sp. S2]
MNDTTTPQVLGNDDDIYAFILAHQNGCLIIGSHNEAKLECVYQDVVSKTNNCLAIAVVKLKQYFGIAFVTESVPHTDVIYTSFTCNTTLSLSSDIEDAHNVATRIINEHNIIALGSSQQ